MADGATVIRDTYGTMNRFSIRLPGDIPARVGLIVFAVLAVATVLVARWTDTQFQHRAEERAAERTSFAAEEASIHLEMVVSDLATIASFIKHAPRLTQEQFVSFTMIINEAVICDPSFILLGYSLV